MTHTCSTSHGRRNQVFLSVTAKFLNKKFDRMARDQKPTGNPKGPSPIRRAKGIAFELMSRANALTIRRPDSDGEDGSYEYKIDSRVDLTLQSTRLPADSNNESINVIPIPNQHSAPKKEIRERKTKRKTGLKGVLNVRRRTEGPLLACGSKKADKFEVMANAVVHNHDGNITSLVGH